jgi:hypothetical protein
MGNDDTCDMVGLTFDLTQDIINKAFKNYADKMDWDVEDDFPEIFEYFDDNSGDVLLFAHHHESIVEGIGMFANEIKEDETCGEFMSRIALAIEDFKKIHGVDSRLITKDDICFLTLYLG